MSDWETEVTATTVRRTGAENSIDRITVKVERTRHGYNSYSRVTYELTFTVNDDGRAAVKTVEDTSTNALPGVSVGHLAALMSPAERAVEGVPDVDYAEPTEDTLSRRRTEVGQ